MYFVSQVRVSVSVLRYRLTVPSYTISNLNGVRALTILKRDYFQILPAVTDCTGETGHRRTLFPDPKANIKACALVISNRTES